LLGAALGGLWRLRAEIERLEPRLHDPVAIVAVSHDRAFLEAIGIERRLEVRDGRVTET
jgi:ATPase subunit of ABC transporter with duplicated ATPase domains